MGDKVAARKWIEENVRIRMGEDGSIKIKIEQKVLNLIQKIEFEKCHLNK